MQVVGEVVSVAAGQVAPKANSSTCSASSRGCSLRRTPAVKVCAFGTGGTSISASCSKGSMMHRSSSCLSPSFPPASALRGRRFAEQPARPRGAPPGGIAQ
jgi:hypothetical protein